MDLENKYGTLEIQKECVKLLDVFHNLCVANDIKYSVAYGTLLGAVRHKGFIPWDDDVDVIVDRNNYEKILSAIGGCKDLTLDRISDTALWTDKVGVSSSDYSGSYAPTLDIFLMDHSPDSTLKSKFKLYIIYMLQGMIKPRLSMKKGNWIMKLFSLRDDVIAVVDAEETGRAPGNPREHAKGCFKNMTEKLTTRIPQANDSKLYDLLFSAYVDLKLSDRAEFGKWKGEINRITTRR